LHSANQFFGRFSFSATWLSTQIAIIIPRVHYRLSKIHCRKSPLYCRFHTPSRINAGSIFVRHSFIKNHIMAAKQKITSNLWFDKEAEEAAKFYTSVFKNSRIGTISRYGKEGFEIH